MDWLETWYFWSPNTTFALFEGRSKWEQGEWLAVALTLAQLFISTVIIDVIVLTAGLSPVSYPYLCCYI